MNTLFARALVAALLVVMSAPVAALAQDGRPGRDVLLAELQGSRVVRDAATGTVTFISGTSGVPAASRARLGNPSTAGRAATAFIQRYGSLLGIDDAAHAVRESKVIDAFGGDTFVRFEQVQDGVPFIAGELTVQVDVHGNVISLIGEASPARAATTRPTLAADDAARTAREAVAKRHPSVNRLETTDPTLALYDPRLVGAAGRPEARLVWRVEVTNRVVGIREQVLVDATTGAVALRVDMVNSARNRQVCDGGGADMQFPCASPVRTEVGGSSAVADVNNAFDYSGDWYDFFSNRFGRDSMDDAGHALVSTVRYCEFGNCAALNAFWDGSQTAYWPGLVTDDVVAHEFTHGFTEFTSGLLYAFQSGAINESLSDIFGELVDLTNGAGTDGAPQRWQMGEDSSLGAIRSMSNPPAHGDPDRMQSSLYDADTDWSDNGGVHSNSGVGNKAAFLMVDGGTFNGQTVTPIGIDKAIAVWYRAATAYLSSGSDYEDLGLALSQACSDLIGVQVKNGAGANAGAITSGNCSQVAKAVVATEMALQPSVSGAAAPEAPICTSGTPNNLLFDQISEGAPGWIATTNLWFYADDYATSNPWSLWGLAPSSTTNSAATRASALSVPSGAFLHFRHYYLFEPTYDGGVIEYSVNGGSTWTDAGGLITHNGYDATLASGNPLGARPAFTGGTWGYISTRLDLASLAGQNVMFRFRIGTDASVQGDGWYIDDFRIYTCATTDTTPPTVGAPNANFRKGVAVGGPSPIKLRIAFTASDPSGIASTRLQRRTNLNPFVNVALGSPTASSVNLAYNSSATDKHQFRAGATDGAGNTSAFKAAPKFRVLDFQDGSASVVQGGGGWTTQTSASSYGGSVRSTAKAGRTQSLTFKMSDAAIVTTMGPNRGKFDVYVDGVFKATIDLYSPTLKPRWVAYAINFGPAAMHTIELRVLGQKNASSSAARVDFDAFLVLGP